MKKIFYSLVSMALLFTACKKQGKDQSGDPYIDPTIHLPNQPPYIDTVDAWLKNHIAGGDYASIDFRKYHISKDSMRWYVKLTLKGKEPAVDFLLLQMDTTGLPLDGRFIHLATTLNARHHPDGIIGIQSLDRKQVMSSAIAEGYVTKWHSLAGSAAAKEQSLPYPYTDLPEVVVYGRPSPNSGMMYDTYFALQSMFAGGKGSTQYSGSMLYSSPGAYNNGNTGGSASGGSSGSGGSASGGNTSGAAPYNGNASANPDYYANIENSPSKPGIDLDGWLKCFTDIPDAGADCSITICADMPVDDDPSVNLNLYNGATGHCFLQLTKTNGAQSVTQFIGFTSQNAMQAVLHGDEFVPSKLVDNGDHKYDAAISMQVTPDGFKTALDEMKFISTNLYSITRFDCLDFDLAVFNSVRGNDPLVLPKNYNTGNTYDVISTGQRFYQFLEDMKLSGDPEAPNIFIGNGVGVFAGQSHGPCN